MNLSELVNGVCHNFVLMSPGKAVEPLATPITWEEPQEEHQDKPHFQEDVQDDTLYFSDSVEKVKLSYG